VRVADLPARYRAGLADLAADAHAGPAALAGAPASERAPVAAGSSTVSSSAGLPDPSTLAARATLPPQGIDLKGHMAEMELELIQAALQQANGVVAHAAPLLGLRRTTLVEKLRKYGIERDSD
jgi:sigma-54 specific flagellar transcriptional regulator A